MALQPIQPIQVDADHACLPDHGDTHVTVSCALPYVVSKHGGGHMQDLIIAALRCPGGMRTAYFQGQLIRPAQAEPPVAGRRVAEDHAQRISRGQWAKIQAKVGGNMVRYGA